MGQEPDMKSSDMHWHLALLCGGALLVTAACAEAQQGLAANRQASVPFVSRPPPPYTSASKGHEKNMLPVGLGVFISTYVLSAGFAATSSEPSDRWFLVPIVGPVIGMNEWLDGGMHISENGDGGLEMLARILLPILDTGLQATGFTLAVVGAAQSSPPKTAPVSTQPPVTLTLHARGNGLALTGVWF